jgi:glycosyltransferase involved in cell wall biosynthesis
LVSSQGNTTTPPLIAGGLETGVYDLGFCLTKMGHEVTIIAPIGSKLENGTVWETIDPTKYDFKTQGAKAEYDASQLYIENLKDFDIVHDHSWYGIAYTAKFGNEGLPVAHTHHGHCDWNIETIPKYIRHLNFFSISDYIKEENEKKGIISKRVYNGTNLEKYTCSENKKNRLLFVGRLNSFKQPHIAIMAAIDTGIPVDIVVSTAFLEHTYQDVIRAWAERSFGMVKLHLNVDNDVKIGLMKKAMATIMPSGFKEPFGSVAVESMACGAPAIVTRDGGLPEVVGEGPDSGGFICDSYEEILEAINNIHTISPERCRKRSELFSREKNAQNYLHYYRQILAGDEW